MAQFCLQLLVLTVVVFLQYLVDISTGNSNQSITSYPVQLCQCTNGQPDCSNKILKSIHVMRGDVFILPLLAVDRTYNPVNATIRGLLHSPQSDLVRGQLTQIPDQCTDIPFRILSPPTIYSEELTLYPSDDLCQDTELSMLKVNVTFLPCSCPIGFEVLNQHSRSCRCTCDSRIRQYTTECNISTNLVQRHDNYWISYINNTEDNGYLVHKCPFDYCNVSAPINLNLPNGSDAQCTLNRTLNRVGVLCGACEHGLSLSLGSSKCLHCPDYWPALFVSITLFAILAGIGLVALFLWLNITVAVGTLNGLLFYANIVAANRVVLLPYPKPNAITIFISWLNLELGIDVCYIKGMNTYIKTWLQLVFPTYIIILVLLLILLSHYSSKFSKLIAK